MGNCFSCHRKTSHSQVPATIVSEQLVLASDDIAIQQPLRSCLTPTSKSRRFADSPLVSPSPVQLKFQLPPSPRPLSEELSKKSLRIAIVGCFGSGKHTLVRLFRLQHSALFSFGAGDSERRSYTKNLLFLLHSAVHHVIKEAGEEDVPVCNSKYFFELDNIKRTPIDFINNTIPLFLGKHRNKTNFEIWLEALWKDKIFRENCRRFLEGEYSLRVLENIPYYMNSNLLLSDEDLLNFPEVSSELQKVALETEKFLITLLNVTGKRAALRQWTDALSGPIDLIVQCVHLNANEKDAAESIDLFRAICTSEWMKSSSVLILLTKQDLLSKNRTSTLGTFVSKQLHLTQALTDPAGVAELFRLVCKETGKFSDSNRKLFTCSTSLVIHKEDSRRITDEIIRLASE